MGCQCSAPISKKDFEDSQKKHFQSYAHTERATTPSSTKHLSPQSTDDEYSPKCSDKKCKRKPRCVCKGSEYQETKKQFELSRQRIKQKSRRRTFSAQQLQNSKDVEESVVVSIYDGRYQEDTETIMNDLKF